MSIIAVGDTAVLPFGAVKRAARGTVRMESPAGISEIVDPALDDADDLVIMTFPGWLVAVGERSQRVLTCEISRPRLRIMGSIGRLELTGYDPGGLHRVRLLAVDDDQCVIETEVGVSLARCAEGLAWRHNHLDLTCRIEEIRDGLIQLRSEMGHSTWSLETGSAIGSEPGLPGFKL